MKKFFNKQNIYIGLFSILYLIVAFSSFFHAISFFGLANNYWMSIILAFAFEIGQAAVLFSLLTSKKDRNRIMPWILMFMFTLVQVIGNVFSSYKYIMNNSIENLRYFKEPIFVWTELPDEQATVLIVYIVGAILPVCALLLTSMITNYLSDIEEIKDNEEENKDENQSSILGDYSILQMENQGLKEENEKLNEKIKNLQKTKIGKINNEIGPKQPIIVNSKKEVDEIYNDEEHEENRINTKKDKSNNDDGKWDVERSENETKSESEKSENITLSNIEKNEKINPGNNKQEVEQTDLMNNLVEDKKENKEEKPKSHFINNIS